MAFIATFPSSHAALAAEQRLLGQGLAVELIPVPRQIHGDCGFCLLVEANESLAQLRACGAQSIWRITETQGPSTRKVKSYERCP